MYDWYHFSIVISLLGEQVIFLGPLRPHSLHLLGGDETDSARETEVPHGSHWLSSPTIASVLPSAQMPTTLVSESQMGATQKAKWLPGVEDPGLIGESFPLW